MSISSCELAIRFVLVSLSLLLLQLVDFLLLTVFFAITAWRQIAALIHVSTSCYRLHYIVTVVTIQRIRPDLLVHMMVIQANGPFSVSI